VCISCGAVLVKKSQLAVAVRDADDAAGEVSSYGGEAGKAQDGDKYQTADPL
jgi:hypothetical protein